MANLNDNNEKNIFTNKNFDQVRFKDSSQGGEVMRRHDHKRALPNARHNGPKRRPQAAQDL